jgi:mono/diheme cytochrome c family protein
MLKRQLKNIGLLLIAGLLISSCKQEENHRGYQYMPDMYDGPALEAYQPYGGSADSTSSRKPVKGTIARGFMSYQEFSSDAAGYESARTELLMPDMIMADEKTMVEAKELYSIFCTQCHGDKGMGQGILVKNEKFLGVPSYGDRDINFGTIFHVITYGKGVMGSHASQVTPEERWKLALYVMKLKDDMTPKEEELTEIAEATEGSEG